MTSQAQHAHVHLPAAAHGRYKTIQEFFVPAYGMCINRDKAPLAAAESPRLNVLRSKAPRNDIRVGASAFVPPYPVLEVYLPAAFVRACHEILLKQDELLVLRR